VVVFSFSQLFERRSPPKVCDSGYRQAEESKYKQEHKHKKNFDVDSSVTSHVNRLTKSF
jgi:hypothetical protein